MAVLADAEKELAPPPDPLFEGFDLAEHLRQNEEALAAFDAQLQQFPQTYQVGDRVQYQGEIFEVHRYQRGGGMTGYWLRQDKEERFIPRDWEDQLQPVAH